MLLLGNGPISMYRSIQRNEYRITKYMRVSLGESECVLSRRSRWRMFWSSFHCVGERDEMFWNFFDKKRGQIERRGQNPPCNYHEIIGRPVAAVVQAVAAMVIVVSVILIVAEWYIESVGTRRDFLVTHHHAVGRRRRYPVFTVILLMVDEELDDTVIWGQVTQASQQTLYNRPTFLCNRGCCTKRGYVR